jgi:hypothetical protein
MALQYLLAPKVKAKPVDVGKQDDVRVTLSDYGAFIPKIFGRARTGGIVIWSSGVEHITVDTNGGGGKGHSPSNITRTHYYLTDLATLVCRGQVTNFLRIWRDQNLVLSDNPNVQIRSFEAEDGTLAGGASVASDVNASGGEYVTGLGSGGKVTFDLSVLSPPGPPTRDPDEVVEAWTKIDFFYKTASDRTVNLKFDGGTPEAFLFTASADWTGITYYYTGGHADELVFENAGAACPDLDYIRVEKFWFIVSLPGAYKKPTYQITGNVNQAIDYPTDPDDPSSYYNAPFTADGNGKVAVSESIPAAATRLYTGTLTQTQDSAITAWLDLRYGTGEGALRCPAWLGYAYVVNENRQLARGAVENDTFEVDCGDNTVNDVLEYVLDQVGITSGYRNLSATSALEFIGFIEHTKQPRRQLVEFLERFFFFRLAEIDGTVKTILDTLTSAATIDASLLRAHEYGEETPTRDAEIIARDASELPREIRVSVMNPDLEYHNDSVPAAVFASVASTESKEYAFPIVETADTARTVAEKLLLKEHSETLAIEFYGMPEMATYAVGDVITVPIDGENIAVRIERKQMTLPLGKIKFQCVGVSPFTPAYYQDDFTSTAVVRPAQFALTVFPRNSVVVAIQSLPVKTAHRARLGVYLAVCGRGRGQGNNISLYRELGTDNWVLEDVIDAPAQVGLAEDALSSWESGGYDTTNTLDIFFFDEITLASTTEADLEANPTLNLIRIDDEWMQYRDATAQTLADDSPYRSKWRIGHLRRGLFGTTASSHSAGCYCVNWTNAVRWFDLEPEYIGETVRFKAVTAGQSPDNAPITSLTFSPPKQFTVTNEAADYTIDADATSTDEVADVVGTITNYLNLS